MTGPETEKKFEIATEDLAVLGNGALGYIREIEPDNAAKLLGPHKMNVPGDIRLYCLYGADGTFILCGPRSLAALSGSISRI